MKKFRLCILLLLCISLCTVLLPLHALAEGSADSAGSADDKTQLTPVEKVFQVISLLILFGGLAMLPVYYVLNRRRRRIIASFNQPKEPEDTPADKTDE
ncbi:MAG: hypothetical protein J1E00_04605 [Oscillospiraceae bacterium]|nr:hypothetical protein [Oscillospiraceae bacterium]